ncbi:MAG TPA: hypothetical protein VN228_03045 [Pyrinomonadaceae bacterium]|nr:hypothetical protein [Pyrinomonadaceae bacterium]
MIRRSNARPAAALCAALLAFAAGACGPGERAGTNTGNVNAGANAGAATPTPAANANADQAGGANAAAVKKLNLNTASGAEFKAAIPGLGDRMVHEFEEYRPYRSLQQFRREMAKYVGPEQIAEYEKYVYVPISRNESDAATLQQIPGLDAAEAQAVIGARPFASDEAFLERLAGSVSEAELAVARAYLSR